MSALRCVGHGKSLMFQVPAKLGLGVCVVVAPLVALVADHIAECRSLGIECQEYSPSLSADKVSRSSILFVSVETAVQNAAFAAFLKDLERREKLHAVFVDEVHLVLEEYRSVMAQVSKLVCTTAPIIGMTATLPPERENDVLSAFQVSGTFLVLRHLTPRPNIEYSVVRAASVDNEICSLLRGKFKQGTAEHAIVYCLSVDEVDGMVTTLEAAGIQCIALHGDLPAEEKKAALDQWKSKRKNIIITTTLLGCGINVQTVTQVIHRGAFYSLTNLHQESGRGGRDGRYAKSIVVTNANYLMRWMKSKSKDSWKDVTLRCRKDREAVVSWINLRSGCRRKTLQHAIDGVGHDCFMVGKAQYCDLCRKVSTSATPQGATPANAPVRNRTVRSRVTSSSVLPDLS